MLFYLNFIAAFKHIPSISNIRQLNRLNANIFNNKENNNDINNIDDEVILEIINQLKKYPEKESDIKEDTFEWYLKNMTDDEKLKRIYQKIFTDAMIYGENYPMQMVAATYLAIAMRLYKTVLSEEEYQEMLKAITESAEKIQPYKDPKGTVH